MALPIPSELRDKTEEMTNEASREARDFQGEDRSYLTDVSAQDKAQDWAGTGAAVSQEMARRFEGDMQTIVEQQSRADKMMKLKKTQLAYQGQMKKYGYYLKRKAAIRRRKMAEDAQRSALIGNVLGLVGAGLGAYFGGPAGAVVGAKAGESAGSSMASSSEAFEGEN